MMKISILFYKLEIFFPRHTSGSLQRSLAPCYVVDIHLCHTTQIAVTLVGFSVAASLL